MSFGGRDNRDGKRKYQWTSYNSEAKRFHGPREEHPRGVGSRWDRFPRPTDQSHSKSHRSFANSWGSRERTNHNRFIHPSMSKNFNQVFDFQASISSRTSKENEETVGPGSDLERMEKVLATKKRIEEALATKSPTNKEINFQNSASSEDKVKDKESQGPNLDLRLTNSDFKEIGSVASVVPSEGDVESVDFMNSSSTSTAHTSQQRSFNSTTSNPPATFQTHPLKGPRVGGWSITAENNIVSEPNTNQATIRENTNTSSHTRKRTDMYIQEQREEILGNVSTDIQEYDHIDHPINKQTNDNQSNYRDEFSRVGRLYQSFLKSRLYGYTLKIRDKSPKSTGQNPLLDKSVLGNQNYSEKNTGHIEDQVIELQMPQPIKVKMENNFERNVIDTVEHIAAEEANEFCKEFSFLLKDPNFLIPPDDLEKLGLGHLREMNKLINEKRNGSTLLSGFEEEESSLSRNVGILNSVSGNDTSKNINTTFPPNILHNMVERETIMRVNERDSLSNNLFLNFGRSSSSQLQNEQSAIRSDIPRKENILFAQIPQVSPFQNVSVEAVVEKVVKTILQPLSINSGLNLSIPTSSETHSNPTKEPNEKDSHGIGRASSSDSKNISISHKQDVNYRIMRLFHIDKQIEDLLAEKMKIFSELFTLQGISPTLSNSCVQDQIQQDNIMNIISNTSNAIPELNRVINHNPQELNPLETSNENGENTIEEAISELYSLKKEFTNPILTTFSQDSESVNLTASQPDAGFIPPPTNVVVEENRPKLSVRKDLIDPNLSNISLLNTPERISTMPSDPSQCNSADQSNTKREKKKKKSKKKDSVEVINLIEDTDEDINSGTGIDSATTEELSTKGLNSEDEVEKKDVSGSAKISYNLDAKTATCMTIMKVKKSSTRVLVVGCKDGCVMAYALGNPAISFTKQIHSDTVTSVYYTHKYLITGSADSKVCLFSLKEQVETQTLSLNAPVQSMDLNFNQLIVGTKTGSIYSYTIKIVADKKKTFVSLHSNKKTMTITNSSILAVKLAKEGVRKVLIVASRGEQITVRDACSGLLLRTFDWCDTVYCLQLYEETPFVFCGTNTKSVKVVNYIDGENISDCAMGRSITQITFLYSVIFAASYDGNIYVYDFEKKSLLATVIISKGIIHCLAIDGKSNVILVASSRGDLQQIPFPPSVLKHVRRIRGEKKRNQNNIQTQS